MSRVTGKELDALSKRLGFVRGDFDMAAANDLNLKVSRDLNSIVQNSKLLSVLDGLQKQADAKLASNNPKQAGRILKEMERKIREELKSQVTRGEFKLLGADGQPMKEDDPDYPEKWADAVLDLFEISPKKVDENFNNKKLDVKLKPSQYKCYKAMQEKIANGDRATGRLAIPTENHRPVIEMTLRGSKAPKKFVSVLGGTGPLSDAEMITKTMEHLENDQFDPERVHIRLLSAPTPRGPAGGILNQPQRMGRYNSLLGEFLDTEDCSTLLLASNTAHGNVGKLESFGPDFFGESRARQQATIANLHMVTDDVVSAVLDDGRVKNPVPLILGTKAARDNRLYAKLFDAKNNHPSVDVENDFHLRGKSDAQKLQDLIDNAKQNGASPQLRQQVVTYVKAQLTKFDDKNITHVMLSCTELPLAVTILDGNGKPDPNRNGTKELEMQLNVERLLKWWTTPPVSESQDVIRQEYQTLTNFLDNNDLQAALDNETTNWTTTCGPTWQAVMDQWKAVGDEEEIKTSAKQLFFVDTEEVFAEQYAHAVKENAKPPENEAEEPPQEAEEPPQEAEEPPKLVEH